TYLRFPGAGQVFSALLNALRLAGLIWAGLSIWVGLYWIGAFLVLYFFLVSGLVVRFDPALYMGNAVRKGNRTAAEQLALIDSVMKKRAAYAKSKPQARSADAAHSMPGRAGPFPHR